MSTDLTRRDRNNRLRSSPTTLASPEEVIAAEVSAEKEISTISDDSAPKDSCEGSKDIVTRDPSSSGHLETLAAVPDGPIVSPPPAPMAAADDVSALDSAQKEPSGRSKNKRKNRKTNNKKLRDGAATAIVNEKAEEPSKSEECPPSVTCNHSYISRIGSIYGRAFISEVIYPFFHSINPLDWC